MNTQTMTTTVSFPRLGSITLLLGATLILNIFDVSMSLYWFQTGVAQEANPLLDMLYQWHPALFVIGKMGLASTGLAVLEKFKERPAALSGSFLVFSVYYTIAIYHCYGLTLL